MTPIYSKYLSDMIQILPNEVAEVKSEINQLSKTYILICILTEGHNSILTSCGCHKVKYIYIVATLTNVSQIKTKNNFHMLHKTKEKIISACSKSIRTHNLVKTVRKLVRTRNMTF